MAADPGGFNVEERARDGRHTLLLCGELDLVSAPTLEAIVIRVCADGATELVLDLTQLGFVDSTGLRAILSSRKLCEEQLCDFWLIPGQPAVQRLFELTGLSTTLPFRTADQPSHRRFERASDSPDPDDPVLHEESLQ